MLCPGEAVAGAHLVPVPLVVDSSEDQDVQDQEAVMMMMIVIMMMIMIIWRKDVLLAFSLNFRYVSIFNCLNPSLPSHITALTALSCRAHLCAIFLKRSINTSV